MKKSVLLLIGLLLTLTISAAKFYPVKITYKDGRIITGTATEPKNHIDPEIAFKEKKKKAKAVNISSNEIKTLEFTFEGGTLEYDRQKTYNDDKEKTMSEEMWLTVALRGRATLYYVDIKGTNMDEGGMVNSTTDRSWLCIRDGEEAATTILWDFAGNLNSKLLLKSKAPIYFADDVEFVAKIKNKTAKWKNIVAMVKEYNAKAPIVVPVIEPAKDTTSVTPVAVPTTTTDSIATPIPETVK